MLILGASIVMVNFLVLFPDQLILEQLPDVGCRWLFALHQHHRHNSPVSFNQFPDFDAHVILDCMLTEDEEQGVCLDQLGTMEAINSEDGRRKPGNLKGFVIWF